MCEIDASAALREEVVENAGEAEEMAAEDTDDAEDRLLKTAWRDGCAVGSGAGFWELYPGTLSPTLRIMLSRLASATLLFVSDGAGGTYEGREYRVIEGGVGIELMLLSVPYPPPTTPFPFAAAPTGPKTPRLSTSTRSFMIRAAASCFGVLPSLGKRA